MLPHDGHGQRTLRADSGAFHRVTSASSEQRREAIRKRCATLGLHVDRVGQAWRIRGLGTYILTSDLSHVTLIDLIPDRLSPDRW